MSTTNGIQKRLRVTDTHGNVWIMTMVDAEARQAIDEGKFMDFDPDYFTSQLSQDQKELKIGLNGVPIGIDLDSPLEFVQDNNQGIVIGSDAPFSTAIAPAFDPEREETYKKNELVMYKGQLCQFTVDHPTGPWISGDNKKVDLASLIKENEKMKTFTTFSNIGLGIIISGNSRAKQASPSVVHTLALDPVSSMVSAKAGFKAGQSVKIVGAQLKAGAAYGLQPPAADENASPAINGKAGVLLMSLFALDSSGDVVGSAISTFTLSVMNWDSWEEKSIEISIPSTTPSGAVGFGLQLSTSSVFEFDDFNIQDVFANEYVKPELLLQVATDKMVKLSDGSDIE